MRKTLTELMQYLTMCWSTYLSPPHSFHLVFYTTALPAILLIETSQMTESSWLQSESEHQQYSSILQKRCAKLNLQNSFFRSACQIFSTTR